MEISGQDLKTLAEIMSYDDYEDLVDKMEKAAAQDMIEITIEAGLTTFHSQDPFDVRVEVLDSELSKVGHSFKDFVQ